MEKINWLFLFLFAFTIAACDDEEEVAPDTAVPVIAITSPLANSSPLVVDEVKLRANVTDNIGVARVWVYLIDTDGSRSQVDEGNIDLVNDNWNEKLNINFFLAEGSDTGTYSIIVKAQDEQQNTSESAVSLTVQAPDLKKDAFNTALTKNTQFKNWITENGGSLTENQFRTVVTRMMDTDRDGSVEENEFDTFTADFGLEHETSADWYWYDEFGMLPTGIIDSLLLKYKFFHDFDLNKNNLLTGTELTGGIFYRWDANKDGVLNRNEYERKMHTYFIP